MEWFSDFWHLVFVAFVSLFAPINPIGSALIVDPFFRSASIQARKLYAQKVALYSFSICVISVLIGNAIFKLFGISLPVVQLAGGIMICRMGWGLLNPSTSTKDPDKVANTSDSTSNIDSILFYPISFPITTGAGTISVLLTLIAHGQHLHVEDYVLNLSAIIVATALMCSAVFLCYANTHILLARVGERGERIINSLSAYLVFCVGIQIGFSGLQQLIR
jgi:multiple antibiotic resistance protein